MNDIEQSYQSSLDFLYSFVDYSLTRQLRYSPDKFNLDRMVRLMSLMGDPQNTYPIVHVAGTKGKGSTSAMIASILQKCGYKVGLYTSPHLHDYVERIQVNGKPIAHAELVKYVDQLRNFEPQVEEITTFELTTAIGFQAFKDAGVDIAVIEVGLGGRLDATNIVTPLVSVITSLSMDHMNILGNTIEKIAFEKGGIIKPGVPVVVSPQQKEAMEVIKSICHERHSDLIDVEYDYAYGIRDQSLDKQNCWIESERFNLSILEFSLNLLGSHQVTNAATAYAIVRFLESQGFLISDSRIIDGFHAVNWPGRFEVVSRDPMMILDCAHNPDSMEKLNQTILEYLPGRKVTLVFGASEDKDIIGMFRSILPICDEVIVTRSVHPRAAEPDLLVELARQVGKHVRAIEPIEAAIQEAIKTSGEKQVILITGSIFIAAAAKEILQKQNH